MSRAHSPLLHFTAPNLRDPFREIASLSGFGRFTRVVGYQTITLHEGFNFVTPSFENVSGEPINVQELKLEGSAVTPLSDSLQILDEGGATIRSFAWDDGSIAGNGWVDFDTFQMADFKIIPGQCVLIDAANAGVTLTFAGAVGTSAITFQSVAGFNFVGNGTPVPVNIQNIEISGNVTPLSDSLQILDEGGATIRSFAWDDGSIAGNGWVDFDTFQLADDMIDPSFGFLIDTANSDVAIKIPSAL